MNPHKIWTRAAFIAAVEAIDAERSEKLSKLAAEAGLSLAEDSPGADFSGSDMRGSNLTDVNLGTANVVGTRFGRNQGLTPAKRANLISRGAIFEDD